MYGRASRSQYWTGRKRWGDWATGRGVYWPAGGAVGVLLGRSATGGAGSWRRACGVGGPRHAGRCERVEIVVRGRRRSGGLASLVRPLR